jgi:hypothetical protein
VAPPGAAVTVAVAEEQVVVDASAMVSGPGGLFEWLPEVRVHARAVAVSEESS